MLVKFKKCLDFSKTRILKFPQHFSTKFGDLIANFLLYKCCNLQLEISSRFREIEILLGLYFFLPHPVYKIPIFFDLFNQICSAKFEQKLLRFGGIYIYH